MDYSQIIQDSLVLLILIILCGLIAVPLSDMMGNDDDDDDDDFYGYR